MKVITLIKTDIEKYVPKANEIMGLIFPTDSISEDRRFYTFNEIVIPSLIVEDLNKKHNFKEPVLIKLPAINLEIQVLVKDNTLNFSVHTDVA